MKVIKEGVRKPNKYEGYWRCSECGRVVLMERDDGHLVKKYHAAQDIRDDTYMGLDCPVCGKETSWYETKERGK